MPRSGEPPTETARVSLRGVTVHRGRRDVVRDVDLDVRPGEVVGLIGANGAGKSTLLAAIAGDLDFTGQIRVGDVDVASRDLERLARTRAVMAQRTAVPFAFTARELVTLGRMPFTESVADRDAAVERALAEVDLGGLQDRPHFALSGGELQRVHFARLLAHAHGLGPQAVLLVDEPTAALDLRHAVAALARLRHLADTGATVIVVLHDLHLASRFCHRLAMLHGGTLLADGPPHDVIRPDLLERAWGTPMQVHQTPTGELVAWAAL